MPDLMGTNAEKAEEQLEKLGVPESRIKLRSDDGHHVVVLVPSNWDVQADVARASPRPPALVMPYGGCGGCQCSGTGRFKRSRH
ncbi:hypothetical protein Scel_44350 [Streptomyces cellostaticus]|nr:hypothetical protein Scel_44350 [Streptomyces cellostaticus]